MIKKTSVNSIIPKVDSIGLRYRDQVNVDKNNYRLRKFRDTKFLTVNGKQIY